MLNLFDGVRSKEPNIAAICHLCWDGIRSFRLRSVRRLRVESIRALLICQFADDSYVEALNLKYEKSLFLVA